MKFTILLLALAALVAVTGSSAIKSTRANLILGNIGALDRLLSRSTIFRPPIVNTIQFEDVIWRGNATNNITAIQAFEVGYTQFGLAQLISGGIGFNNATVRFTSARGYGYYYSLDIWGR